MLVWLKNSDTGKWTRTGDAIEKYVQIATDTKPAGNGLYLLADGISAVEKAISIPDNKHFRYELPGASVAALRRAGVATDATPTLNAVNAESTRMRKVKIKVFTPKPKKAAKVQAEEPARITAAKTTLELKSVESYKAFMATVHGKKAVVVFQERNRSKAELRNNPVTIPESRFADGSKLAKESGAPIYVGLQVKVAGRWDSGWLIPAVLFKQWRRKQDFVLTPDARAAYAADKSSVLGVRFVEAKA
jgi:hypothetical protein